MSQTKNTKRLKSKALGKTVEEKAVEIIDVRVQKNKKPLELELPEEPLAAAIEEKAEDETAAAEETEGVAADEAALDDDELNPFGDKWEQ